MPELSELSVNTEKRRPGEVSLGMVDEHSFFAWVTVAEAREFAMRILVAARDAEDLEAAHAS